MEADIRYKPSFAAIFLKLVPGEFIMAEADAMVSMDEGTQIRTKFNGGFLPALLRRIFGKESMFVNVFSCPKHKASSDLVLSQAFPGDIVPIELHGTMMYLQPGAFVACTSGIKLGVGYAGIRSWINREGLFRLKVSGRGIVWIGAYGGIFEREVQNEYIVDTGHLVAYEPTLSIGLGLAGGVFSSFFGGEGLVARMRGQGKIYMQSRSMDGLAAWTNAHLY
ncbi:MAG: TIGR00266 family protein [Myxococcales bacterium]|nr:MAG: TIGR00266 family protein [Myxococcales bacterium]